MIPPVVGLGNNGDFGKVSGYFSIGYPAEQEARYAPVKFHFDRVYRYHSGFRSSEMILAAAAVGLSSIVAKSNDFDIRWIGAVHGALFLCAIYLLLPVLVHFFGLRARMCMLLAIALILGDVMYISFFNSFYMDGAALVFAALAAVFFLRGVLWRRPADLIGLAVCGVLLAGSKPQHAFLTIPIVVLLITARKHFLAPAITWVAVVATILAAGWTSTSMPRDYARNAWYDVIFLGLLPYSPAPADDLAELGLDRAYVSYSRTSAFYPTSGFSDAGFTKEFMSRVGPAELLRFYARHPVRTFELLVRAFDDAGNTRPNLGNFDPGAGYPPFAQSHAFALWSGLRESLFANHGLRYLLITVVLLAILLARAGSRWRIAAVCLTIAVLLEAGVAGLGDAAEAPRHFTLFAELQDIGVLTLVAGFLPRRPDAS